MVVRFWRSVTGFSGRLTVPAVLRLVIPSFAVSAIIISFLFVSGCSSIEEAVNVYTEKAGIIIDDLNKSMAELKNYWVLPLVEQGDLKDAQEEYGKSVDEVQDLIDHVDAPKACRDLENQLAMIEEKAKSINRMTTPFSDFMDDMSGVAVEIEDLISELEVFQKKKDLQTGVRQMYDKANSIYSEVKSKVPPPLFQGIQAEFIKFMGGFTEQFYKAAERASNWSLEEETRYEDEGESREDGDEDEAGAKDNYRNSALEPFLENIPDDWEEFNADLNEWMAAAREVGGLNTAYLEMEQMVVQAVAEMQKLQKKYPL